MEKWLSFGPRRPWTWLTLLVLCLGGYVGCSEIGPRTEGAWQLYETWQAERARIAAAHDSEAHLHRLQQRLVQLQQNYQQVSVRLPQGDEMSALLQLFRNATAEAEVRLVAVRPQPRQEEATHIILPFALTLEGRFHEVGTLVSALEQAPYLIEIQGLTATTADLATATLDVELTLSVFSLRPREDSQQPPAQAP